MRMIRCFFTMPILLIILCFSSSEGIAQQEGRLGQVSSGDSVAILRSILEEKRNDRERLGRMLGAVNLVDSVYKIHYPTWVVLDEDLRHRILRAFRVRRGDVPQDTTVRIVTTPDRSEIVEISLGPAVMGRLETRTNLSDSLQIAILAADYPLRRVDVIPPVPRKTQLFGSRPKMVTFDASAYGAELLFSNGWGVEVKIGNDEIGYPFWLTGSARVFAVFNRLKMGLMAPFKFGGEQPEILEPLTIRPRRLNGATGFSAEFDQPVNSHSISVRFTIGELTKLVSDDLTDNIQPYYLHTVGQLFYSRNISLGQGKHLFTLSGGLGFHQIALGEVQYNNRIVTIEKSNFLSPLLRVDYICYDTRMYGISIQYYSSILFVTGWLEFIKNFVYLDLRYSTTIIRDLKPWEQPYFVMVSPRFRLGI